MLQEDNKIQLHQFTSEYITMNSYEPPIRGYKSPMKKISHASSKLASAAVQRGSMIIDSASTAVQNARSPPRGPNQQQNEELLVRIGRSGAGIREKINKFEYIGSQAPHRRVNRNAKEQTHPLNRKYPSAVEGGSTGNVLEEQVDKENATNISPTKQGKLKQKFQETFSPTKIDALQKVHSVFSPMKHDTEDNVMQKVKDTFSPLTKRGSDQKSREISPRPGKGFTNKYLSNKTDECAEFQKRLQQLEQKNINLKKKNQYLVSKCKKLIERNEQLEALQIEHTDCNNTKRSETKKNRLSNEHPLISSPLRNHIRIVKEASETNSFVSVRKEPFALFPPEYLRDNDGSYERGIGPIEESGIITDDNKILRNASKRKNEEATDLLNSAAFLFKTSRRRLY